MRFEKTFLGSTAILAAVGLCGSAQAVLSFTIGGSWDTTARSNAAAAAMTNVVNRYNIYGDFGNYNIYTYYNAGIPTAQASYEASIGFGGTYPNDRVSQHESNHYLGSGTYWNWANQYINSNWTGQKVNSLMAQFDGNGTVLKQSGVHFYGYGLNYDTEVVNDSILMRNIAVMYAMRQDMGNGNVANPWSASSVTLGGSDPIGTSAFNWFGGGYSNASYQGWSDRYFPHAGAAYFTGDYTLRTPLDTYNPSATTPSFNFGGDFLTVNNTNGINGGLLYKGVGTSGVLTIKNLNLNGGYVRHASGAGDLFQLGGRITLTGNPTIDAAQGNIRILAPISGSGSLNIKGAFATTLSGISTYAGATNITSGTLRLATTASIAVANYTFDNVSGTTVINGGTGGSSMNGTLANGAAIVPGGQSGNAVSFTSGASVDINNPVTDLGSAGNWTVSAWVKTTTPGATILSKADGGWTYGNSVFYLGDGSAGGSGGIPSSVRWAGGFFQASNTTTPVTDGSWHMVTYVNNSGTYSIYTDGVARSLSAGNSALAASDIGSLIKLGFTTNTVPADGAVNFMGLMDSVQIHSQALSTAQIAALYQGLNVGPLPSTTDVTVAGAATLDVNGVVQQIGSLTGAPGSAITLGNGQLIVSSALSSTFAGVISGASGSIIKSGSGTLTLSGANTYTGATTITNGTLFLGYAARNPVLTGAGAILNGGTLVMNYAGGSSPKTTIVADLTANAGTGFLAGKVRTTFAPDATKAIGWLDDNSSTFQARYTYKGDVNLSGSVDSLDFNALAGAYGKLSNAIWAEGDSNYDGKVNTLDFNFLAGNFNLAPIGGSLASAPLGAVVPEPSTLGFIGLTSITVLARRRRNAVR